MPDCIFCKIVRKEIQSHIIGESNNAIALLDIHPLAPGHAMVLPKKHREAIIAIPDEEIGGVFRLVKEATMKLDQALSPDGFTIGINHGTNAGQAVPHLHVHIIPRYKGDGGGSIHSIVKNPPKESVEEIKSKILSSKP